MTDKKLERKIEKLLNYKLIDYLSNGTKIIHKSTISSISSSKPPKTDRLVSRPSKTPYPIVSPIPKPLQHKRDQKKNSLSDLPSILTEVNNETHNEVKKKRIILHSFNNISNVDTNITEDTHSFVANQNSSIPNIKKFNTKMTGLMQFKTNSNELNHNGYQEYNKIKPHYKRPEFSIDFTTKSNTVSNVINERSVLSNISNIKSKKVLAPIKDIKCTIKLKKTTLSDLKSVITKKDDRSTETNTKEEIHHTEASFENLSDDTSRKTHGVEVRKNYQLNLFLPKIKDYIKNSIKKNTKPLNQIQNPYEPIQRTFKFYYTECLYQTNEDDIKLMTAEIKYLYNPLPYNYKYYEYTFAESNRILNTYFDCFPELIRTFIDSTTTTGQKIVISLNNYDLRRRLSCIPQPIHQKNNNDDFDILNQEYIYKFILYSNTNWFSQKVYLKMNEIKDPRKRPIERKNRTSIRMSAQFIENKKVSQSFKYKRAKTKLEDYNIFMHKQNVNKEPVSNVLKHQRRSSIVDEDLTPSELWKRLLNDIFYNKRNHFIELFTKKEKEFDINKQDEKGNSLLIYATQNNTLAIVEFLLEKGCDVNLQNHFGNTALHYSISHKLFSITNTLIKYNAMENLKNNIGLIPWECLNKDCENII